MSASQISSETEKNKLVAGIYETIRNPQSWPALIERIGAWLGADCGLMLTPSLPGISPVPLFAYNLDVTPILDAYPRHAGRAEFTKRAMATGRAPGAFLLDELMPPAEQRTSEFWKDIVAPIGLVSGIFGLVRTPDDGDRPIVFNYYRRAPSVPFTKADAARFEQLFPDLRRALAVSLDASPRTEISSGVADIYDAIGVPSILIGPSGTVVHTNHAANVLLKANDGISLCESKIALWDSHAQRDLTQALVRVIGDEWSAKFRTGAELLAKRPSGGAAMVLVLTPVGAENPIAAFVSPVRCAMFVLEEKLRANGLLPDRLRRLYGLTAAETEICLEFAAGRSLKEISEQRGTTIDTVRSQVKSALAKTGSRRQAELASLVNRIRY